MTRRKSIMEPRPAATIEFTCEDCGLVWRDTTRNILNHETTDAERDGHSCPACDSVNISSEAL